MRRVARQNFSDPKIFTTQYDKFLGCHFSTDPSVCEATHSPDCLNMLPDASGFPEKRPGWRELPLTHQKANVNGIHFLDVGEQVYSLVKVGTTYYGYEGYFKRLLFEHSFSGKPAKSWGIAYDGKMVIFDGALLLLWTGEKLMDCVFSETSFTSMRSKVSAGTRPDVFVPTTSINRVPATGGGDTYQKVNLLTPWRINTFIGDGSAKTYKLDGTITAAHGVPYAFYSDSGQAISIASYTGDTVTFSSAPSAPAISGTANVSIAFAHFVDGYSDMIASCRFATLYGYNAENRIFCSGNENYQNRIFYTENNNPLYFADLNYIDIGVANFPITAFHKTLAGELAVFKRTNPMESNVWHVGAEISSGSEGDSIQGNYFPVREGVSGTGAVNPYCQQQLKNDVLFLAPTGVYDLKTSFSYSKYISNVVRRSDYVNIMLQDDWHVDGLVNAFSVKWRSYYLLFFATHVYLMTEDHNWFYWDNFDFCFAAVHDDDLFFGDRNGKVFRFNCDLVSDGALLMDAFSDGALQKNIDDPLDLVGGVPIKARWTSHISTDGDLFRKKDLQKNGFGIYVKNYTKTSCNVYVKALDASMRFVKNVSAFAFDFNNIDFKDFSFISMPSFRAIIRSRLRGYAALQVVVENDKLNEAFGLFLIQYNYLLGNNFRR